MASNVVHDQLQDQLGITWRKPTLLIQALSDRSFVHENPGSVPDSNQRLAFLGDAVLELAVREELYVTNPTASKGTLSKKADLLVANARLAEVAREIGLGPALNLGNVRKEEDQDSVLAAAIEAILAAVYLDQDLPAVVEVLRRWLGPEAFVIQPGEDVVD